MTNGSPNESICPKGWKLPSRAQANGLVNNYSGFIGPSESIYRRLGFVYWWTSEASRNNMSIIHLKYEGNTPSMSVLKWTQNQIGGASIRCVQE